MAVATRLFAERGFGQTSMSDIARAAGLQQPSVYYWFRRKELILQAAFAVDRAPLEFVERIGDELGSPALKLYRLVRFDAYQLCLSPCDVNEVARLASQQPELLGEFFYDRQRLHAWIVRLVRTGFDAGQFVDTAPDLAAWCVLASDAGVQSWFRYQDRQPTDGRQQTTPHSYNADEVATSLADTSVRALLKRPRELVGIRAQAARFDDLSHNSSYQPPSDER